MRISRRDDRSRHSKKSYERQARRNGEDLDYDAEEGYAGRGPRGYQRPDERITEDLAHDVSGVKDVMNHLRVRSDARAGAGPAGGDLS